MIFIPLLYQLIAYIRGGQLYQWLCYVEFGHCAEPIYCMRNSDIQISIRLVAAAQSPMHVTSFIHVWAHEPIHLATSIHPFIYRCIVDIVIRSPWCTLC